MHFDVKRANPVITVPAARSREAIGQAIQHHRSINQSGCRIDSHSRRAGLQFDGWLIKQILPSSDNLNRLRSAFLSVGSLINVADTESNSDDNRDPESMSIAFHETLFARGPLPRSRSVRQTYTRIVFVRRVNPHQPF